MFKKVALVLIKGYQLTLGQILPKSCVFYAHGKESCSEYAIKVINKKGFIKGVFFTGYRIMRCHPWQNNFSDPNV